MPLIKEKRMRRGKKALVGFGRATQCITIEGNQKAATSIAQNYLSEYPEVANWDVNVKYSENKNNRWKIAQSLKNAFTDDKENLEDEDMNVVAVVVPDPNLVTAYNNQDSVRYFMSNQNDDIFIGKAKSRAPKHDFDRMKDVKFNIEDEALDTCGKSRGYNGKGAWHNKELYPINWTIKKGGRKKNYFYNEDIEEDELESDLEENTEDISNSPKQLSLKDFLQNSSPEKTREKNSSNSDHVKKFKGKVYYDPDFIQDIEIDEEISEEEYETIQEIDTSDEKVIVFLSDVDPIASNNWEQINDAHLERITMVNKTEGIIVSIHPKQLHETMIECELKVSSMLNDVKDVIPMFSECTTIFDISNMAQHFLARTRYSVVDPKPGRCCLYPHTAGLQLLEMDIAAYENKMKDEVITVDDYCNVCFDSDVPLDYCSCGEGFCCTCWSMYLSSIKETNKFIQCPGYDCKAPVPVSILAWYLPNEKLTDLLLSAVQHSIETDYNVHQCIRSSCNKIVLTDFTSDNKDDKDDGGIECVCGSQWCRWCNEEYHYPSSCQDKHDFAAYERILRVHERLETVVEARPCPKCETMWEKMFGCNLMHCSICDTGFCWGCGKEHTDYNGICGKITVPLQSVEILPFPTEDFTKTRIEAFNLYSTLKVDKVARIHSKNNVTIIKRFLYADKTWFQDNIKHGLPYVMETDRAHYVSDVINRAITICKQGSLSLLNSLLKKSVTKQDNKKIKQLFFTLRFWFDLVLECRPNDKNWETKLKNINVKSNFFQKILKLKLK